MKIKEKTIKITYYFQKQQPKNDNVNININNRTLLVEPSFSSKTFLMLKILSRMPVRDIYKFTKSPPEKIFEI